MNVSVPHGWGYDLSTCRSIQEWLRYRVIKSTLELTQIRRIAFVHVSKGTFSRVSVGVYTLSDLMCVSYTSTTDDRESMDYPRDLEMFSYGKLLVSVLRDIDRIDLVIINKEGLAHPRYLGPASHLGLIIGIPTIGVVSDLEYGSIRESNVMIDEITFKIEDDVITACKKLEVTLPIGDKVYGGIVGRVVGDYKATVGHMCDIKTINSIIAKIVKNSNAISCMIDGGDHE
jgi:deoxyinosine 3'endonuclease (endonuclease V)